MQANGEGRNRVAVGQLGMRGGIYALKMIPNRVRLEPDGPTTAGQMDKQLQLLEAMISRPICLILDGFNAPPFHVRPRRRSLSCIFRLEELPRLGALRTGIAERRLPP